MKESLRTLFREQAAKHPLEPIPTDYPAHLEALAGIRAVVFDIYGTLVISGSGDISLAEEAGRADAFREAFAAVGCPFPSAIERLPELFFECIRSHQDLVRRESGVTYPEIDILRAWKTFLHSLHAAGFLLFTPAPEDLPRLAVELECRLNPVAPMPGLSATLARLRASGRSLGIVSNAQFYTPLMMEAFLGQSLEEAGFDPDLCVYSYREREGKPSTALYAKLADALRCHSIRPAETLYVGNDLRNDVWPAGSLGFRTALFAGDERSLRLRQDDPRLADVTPDRVVHALGDLARLLPEPD